MLFEGIFFIFLNLENGLFQTHPPTKSEKFQIFFLSPSLKRVGGKIKSKMSQIKMSLFMVGG